MYSAKFQPRRWRVIYNLYTFNLQRFFPNSMQLLNNVLWTKLATRVEFISRINACLFVSLLLKVALNALIDRSIDWLIDWLIDLDDRMQTDDDIANYWQSYLGPDYHIVVSVWTEFFLLKMYNELEMYNNCRVHAVNIIEECMQWISLQYSCCES